MSRDEVLIRIKQAVIAVEPGAEVILYGSRARNTENENSDWDILVLTGHPDRETRSAIRRGLYEIEWQSGEVISTSIRGRDEWSGPHARLTQYHRNIEREGIRL
jgi:predicted nucleotidyltransferase